MNYELEVGVTGQSKPLIIACDDWRIGIPQGGETIPTNLGSLGLFRVEDDPKEPYPNYILLAHFAAGGWTYFCIRRVYQLVNKDDPMIRETVKFKP